MRKAGLLLWAKLSTDPEQQENQHEEGRPLAMGKFEHRSRATGKNSMSKAGKWLGEEPGRQ